MCNVSSVGIGALCPLQRYLTVQVRELSPKTMSFFSLKMFVVVVLYIHTEGNKTSNAIEALGSSLVVSQHNKVIKSSLSRRSV